MEISLLIKKHVDGFTMYPILTHMISDHQVNMSSEEIIKEEREITPTSTEIILDRYKRLTNIFTFTTFQITEDDGNSFRISVNYTQRKPIDLCNVVDTNNFRRDGNFIHDLDKNKMTILVNPGILEPIHTHPGNLQDSITVYINSHNDVYRFIEDNKYDYKFALYDFDNYIGAYFNTKRLTLGKDHSELKYNILKLIYDNSLIVTDDNVEGIKNPFARSTFLITSGKENYQLGYLSRPCLKYKDITTYKSDELIHEVFRLSKRTDIILDNNRFKTSLFMLLDELCDSVVRVTYNIKDDITTLYYLSAIIYEFDHFIESRSDSYLFPEHIKVLDSLEDYSLILKHRFDYIKYKVFDKANTTIVSSMVIKYLKEELNFNKLEKNNEILIHLANYRPYTTVEGDQLRAGCFKKNKDNDDLEEQVANDDGRFINYKFMMNGKGITVSKFDTVNKNDTVLTAEAVKEVAKDYNTSPITKAIECDFKALENVIGKEALKSILEKEIKMPSTIAGAVYGFLSKEAVSIDRSLESDVIQALFTIKDIKFNGNRVIVFWIDNTKTIVAMQDEESKYDMEKAILAAYTKKILSYFSTAKERSMDNLLDKWNKKYKKEEKIIKAQIKRVKDRKACQKKKEEQ